MATIITSSLRAIIFKSAHKIAKKAVALKGTTYREGLSIGLRIAFAAMAQFGKGGKYLTAIDNAIEPYKPNVVAINYNISGCILEVGKASYRVKYQYHRFYVNMETGKRESELRQDDMRIPFSQINGSTANEWVVKKNCDTFAGFIPA